MIDLTQKRIQELLGEISRDLPLEELNYRNNKKWN